VEVYWNFALFVLAKSLSFGSPKSGSFSNRIIISKIPAPANTKREVFAELLRIQGDDTLLLVSDIFKQVDEFNVLDKFYGNNRIATGEK
jgi:hypothetical protein